MTFKVSVIIPAFNASLYIEKAIMSALSQKEVDEVLVINDGSTDGTKDIVNALVVKFPKVKFLTHENEINKGRSASRNLGIETAKSEFIAFLDADDFYLENRFDIDKTIFKSDSKCDGVYNAVGFLFYNYSLSETYNKDNLYTVRKIVPSSELFEGLLHGTFGHFQIDGLTVRKSLFIKTGLFNNGLAVGEDTDIFWKMALVGKLHTGEINKPVAMRGVHESNVFYRDDIYDEYRYKIYESIIYWCSRNSISLNLIDEILKRLWIIIHADKQSLSTEIKSWRKQFLGNPRILFSYLSMKYFPIVRRRKKIFSFFYNQ